MTLPDTGVYANAAYDPARVPAPAPSGAPQFHRSRPGYRTTPLHDLRWPLAERELTGSPATTAARGPRRVWVKDESDRFDMPAFKILGASWAVEQALRAEPGTTTLVAASAGNHGRAVARCSRDRGLASRIILPVDTPPTAVAAIRNEGASVTVVDGDYDAAVAAAAALAAEPGHMLIADVGDAAGQDPTPGWVVQGYRTMFAEIDDQRAGRPIDVVIVPIGVGSLAAAAIGWAVSLDPPVAVVGVEPAAAPSMTASLQAGHPATVDTRATSMAGLNCPTPSVPVWPTVLHGLAGTVVVNDTETAAAAAALARHGVVLGPCGSAPAAALARLLDDPPELVRDRLGPDATVVLLGTEGVADAVRP